MTVKVLTTQEQLSELFGSYKAEWLRDQMFELFAEPDYFPELITPRPCILLGGRGTGKTTVLRCLSYEGQFARAGHDVTRLDEWKYFGFYYRVNTNRVTAFRGAELSDERWQRVFAHYLNLLMTDLVVRFLNWYQLQKSDAELLSPEVCGAVAASLHLDTAHSVSELASKIAASQSRFEAFINNVKDDQPLPLSMQGAPVDILLASMLQLPHFVGKYFFFLIDEYENFLNYQQQVVNTLIKHSGEHYTFKVGVKELGIRRRTTLNENEQLVHPADYVRINIGERLEGERFNAFALRVCNSRIGRLRDGTSVVADVRQLLPGMSEDKEAEVLDAAGDRPAQRASAQLELIVPSEDRKRLETLTLLQRYLLALWAVSEEKPLDTVWADYIHNQKVWSDRFSNYTHSLLFTLRRGKRGIQKYYAGWSVFTQLAAGNIRYFLELVDNSLLLHLQNKGRLDQAVPFRIQTLAAQAVGKKNLAELEGLSIHGAQLTKLLLGLGRVFQVMAADPLGHAPEVNQFHLADPDDPSSSASPAIQNANELLSAAVMHLALLRTTGNKLGDDSDTREYDYSVHPIFSPFFVFSYRRKRKMTLSAEHLLGLVSDHRRTIREILAKNNRTADEPLPDQLLLFEGYYDGKSAS